MPASCIKIKIIIYHTFLCSAVTISSMCLKEIKLSKTAEQGNVWSIIILFLYI